MFLSGGTQRIKIPVTRINYSCGGNGATANNGQKQRSDSHLSSAFA